jgi:hypothetical protein
VNTQTLKNKRPGSDGNRSGPWFKHPAKEIEMNNTEHSTAAAIKPDGKRKPTDQEIVKAVDDLLGDVYNLKRAAVVLDDYAGAQLRRAKDPRPNALFDYALNKEQVEGFTYMLEHVRDLAEALELGFDKAFGMEVQS